MKTMSRNEMFIVWIKKIYKINMLSIREMSASMTYVSQVSKMLVPEILKQSCAPHFQSPPDTWSFSMNVRNKLMHIQNGNKLNKLLIIFHWNMGSRFWVQKHDEIQSIVDELNPDVMFIMEANVFSGDPEHLLQIDRYTMEYPKTWINPSLKYARIIMLIKSDLLYEVMEQHMEQDILSMWIKINIRGRRKLVIGGLYREFRLIRQDNDDTSDNIAAQEDRWRRITEQWEAATAGADSVIIGDINLDFVQWENPAGRNINMIEKTKTTIGSDSFHQVVTGITHTWPGTRDTLIDQCWVNTPEKVEKVFNIINSSSDHNIVGIILRISGVVKNCHQFRKRKWADFDPEEFNLRIKEINWDTLYQMTDVNLAWDYMESNITDILKISAPVVTVQPRNKYKKWLSSQTKTTMEDRYLARAAARTSGTQEDYQKYKKLRNKVTSQTKKDKKEYLNKIYKECEEQKDTTRLYSTAKAQAGWNRTGPPASLVIEGQKVTSPKDIAQGQMNYFHMKNQKLLDEVEGGDEISPVETLKLSLENWKKQGNKIPSFKFQKTTPAEENI